MCILTEDNREQASAAEVFCGTVKSFNTRRGFGFLSCEETALLFGRDVYLSKDEALLLSTDVTDKIGTEAAVAAGTEKLKVPSPVEEGDVLLFQVKLSTEGFPQAIQAKKIHRLRGIVQQVPSPTEDGIILVRGSASTQGQDASHSLDHHANRVKDMLGTQVQLSHSECGQLKLMPNDEVAFCCADSGGDGCGVQEAQLVELLCTSRAAGSVLGCFSLILPYFPPKASDDEELPTVIPSVELQGHALTDCVYLSDVPLQVNEVDLMRLFGKLGAKEAMVTPVGNTHSFATVFFTGHEHVAKFLVQAIHAVSENGMTQLAHVGPCLEHKCGICGCKSKENSAPSANCQILETGNCQGSAQVIPQSMCTPSGIGMVPVQVQQEIVMLSMAEIPAPQTSAVIQEEHGGSVSQQQRQGIFSCACSHQHILHVPAHGSTCPDWRCSHGNILFAPCQPEILVSVSNGCHVRIQWPTVVHATGYVVELLNQSTMIAQRFMRVMLPEEPLPVVVDLQVDGLQSGTYAACVRCVAPCGCESSPSPSSFLSVGATQEVSMATRPQNIQVVASNALATAPAALPLSCPPHFGTPPSCPPPPSAPPSLHLSAIVPSSSAMLPQIPEEAIDDIGNEGFEILTLD
jgi:hypothetical protein